MKNKPLFLGFLEYSGLTLLNKKYFNGIPTYEILNRKKSIIDFALANSEEVVEKFEIIKKNLGVSPQTCHKVLKICISVNFNDPVIIRPNRLNFNSIGSRKVYFSKILASFEILTKTPYLLSYKSVEGIYTNAKKQILGKFNPKRKNEKLCMLTRQLQEKFRKALVSFNMSKKNSSIEYANFCERNLYLHYAIDKQNQYLDWLRKLEKLDHQKRARIFFQCLKSKNRTNDFFGPIRNLEGKLSNSHIECLEYWSNYCESLYSKTCKKELDLTPIENPKIDHPITFEEFISVVKSLKNNKAPGSDFITNEDFKNLLESDEEILGGSVILQNVFKLISRFWEKEQVPSELKKVILRPFIKDSSEEEHDPNNYRTISLLNTLFKIYEGIIHNRLSCFLEKKQWFSYVQSAYRKSRSTVDNILVLQELFLEYRFNKTRRSGNHIKKPLYWCFMDLRKAFDTVIRRLLFLKLYNCGIRGKMFRVIRDIYTGN